MMKPSKLALAALAIALSSALAGCSGNVDNSSASSDDSTSPDNNTAAPSATGDTSGITAQGEAAAEAAGGSVDAPQAKIGWVYYGANGIASQRSYNGVQAAADVLGWDVVKCDGQGIPAEQQKCASNLLNEGVQALVVNTIDTATMADAIKQAAAEDVPIVSIGGSLETSEGYAGSYAPDEAGMGTALAQWISDKIGSDGGVIEQTFPAQFAVLRNDAMNAVYDSSGIEVLSNFDADPVDLVAATQKQTSAQLSANPDAKAVTMVFSTAEIGASQALVQQFGAGKSYPERPLLTTYYANLPVLDMIGKGQVDAAAENPLEWTGWVAVDQLAEFFARQTEMSQDERPDYGDGLDFWRPTVVDSTNLPTAGQLLPPPVDFAGFFTAKWTAEFGV